MASRKPNIGLVGFYGWGNYGDELFSHVFRDRLDNSRVAPINELIEPPYFRRPVADIVAEQDLVLIGGGDLLFPWGVSPLYWRREYLSKPVIVYGIGVPTWRPADDDAMQRYREFLSHPAVRWIVFRDRESLEWARKNLPEAGDRMTWYPDVCAAPDWRGRAGETGGKVFTLVTRAAHRELDISNIQAMCRRAGELGYRIHHLILGTGKIGGDDVAEARDMDIPGRRLIVPETIEQATEYLLQSDLVASMKFHGSVVAMMAGIPALALNKGDKFIAFYRMMGRENWLRTIGAEDLPERITELDRAEVSPGAIDEIRRGAREGLAALEARLGELAGTRPGPLRRLGRLFRRR